MRKYVARVRREGRWWIVEVPEIGEVTQARRIRDVTSAARELIAVTLDLPLESVDVAVDIEPIEGVDVAAGLAHVRTMHESAMTFERQARAEVAGLAQALSAADVPLRDVGAILGISHQRAHQLILRTRPLHQASTTTSRQTLAGPASGVNLIIFPHEHERGPILPSAKARTPRHSKADEEHPSTPK